MDEPHPNAAVCANSLMLSRGLLESPHLPAVLAHELGHLANHDGRTTAALNRLLINPPSRPPAQPTEVTMGRGAPPPTVVVSPGSIRAITLLGLFALASKRILLSSPHRRRTGRADFEQLGRRDLDLLGWVCEQHAARLAQVQALLDEGAPAATEMVDRLCRVGFARTQRYLVDEPAWLLPTQRGLRVCGLVCRPRSLMVGRIAHIAAINDVRLHIQRRAPQTLWIPERQLLMEHTKAEHPPDGLAIVDSRQVAVEVELTPKRPHRVRDTVVELERRYEEVLYFCAPAPHRQLSRLAQGGGHPKLGVRRLPGDSPPG